MTMILKCLISLTLVYGIGYCIKFIPQRAIVLYVDPDALTPNSTVYVKRYGRRSPYYFNVDGEILKPWYNNVSIHLIFYEYLHNEYRRSFVELHYRMCDFLNKELYAGGMFKSRGVVCPVFGVYQLRNLTFAVESFTWRMPFDKTRVDIIINKTDSSHMLFKAQLYMIFKEN